MSFALSEHHSCCLDRKNKIKQPTFKLMLARSPINTGASSSSFNSKCSAANRLAKVRILKDGEAASIKYLTNAQGQQVFKSEPKPDQYLPSQSELGTGFIAWLKTNFGWLYAQAQTDASLGSAYTYADGQLPNWAVLGEYDNGSASGTGRTEYIWLPTEDGGAVPVGMFRNSKFFAIHSDHLGTPRLMTDSLNKPVWQWPYSAFGNNKPTGILRPTASATGAFTNQPNLLATQNPAAVLDLRFPGQMADEETGLFYNYFRNYLPGQGRYTQNDPIGLDGGLNRFGYVGGNPLTRSDPEGLDWYRNPDSAADYAVGRRGHPVVPPGGIVSRFVEQCIPAGRTFGQIHDDRVDQLISQGVPDWRANIPTMPGAYKDAIRQETGNSLRNLDINIRNLYRR